MTLTIVNVLPLLYLLGAIGLDTAAGVAVAKRAGVFQWTKLPQYVETTVHPFISPVAVLTVVTGFLNGEHSFATAGLNAALVAIALSYTPRFVDDAKAKWLAFSAGVSVKP